MLHFDQQPRLRNEAAPTGGGQGWREVGAPSSVAIVQYGDSGRAALVWTGMPAATSCDLAQRVARQSLRPGTHLMQSASFSSTWGLSRLTATVSGAGGRPAPPPLGSRAGGEAAPSQPLQGATCAAEVVRLRG